MEIIIGNEDKRNYSNMKMKARVLLENSRGEIVVSSYGGIYLLPGGSIDDGENPNTAILREIKEELGFDMKLEELTQLTKIKYFQSNYPTRDNSIEDRLLITYYYLGKAEKISNNNSLTVREKEDGFTSKFYTLNEVKDLIKGNPKNNPRKEYFDMELKTVIDFYKEYNKEKEVNER